MTVTGLHHASLTVADLDRSLHFYRDLLGVRAVREQVDAAAETFAAVSGEGAQHVRIADLDLGDGRVLELIEDRRRWPAAPADRTAAATSRSRSTTSSRPTARLVQAASGAVEAAAARAGGGPALGQDASSST